MESENRKISSMRYLEMWKNFKQTDRHTNKNCIDNEKSQLDLNVMCIHGMQHKTKHRQTLTNI